MQLYNIYPHALPVCPMRRSLDMICQSAGRCRIRTLNDECIPGVTGRLCEDLRKRIDQLRFNHVADTAAAV